MHLSYLFPLRDKVAGFHPVCRAQLAAHLTDLQEPDQVHHRDECLHCQHADHGRIVVLVVGQALDLLQTAQTVEADACQAG